MNWADWAIVGILTLSVLFGLVRGFLKEVMSLVAWIAAIVVAMMFYQDLAPRLTEFVATPSLRLLVAWFSLFIIVLIIGGLINYLLAKLIFATGLSGTDRLLGLIFGASRGIIVILLVLILLPDLLPVNQDAWWHESILIPEFLRFEGRAKEIASTVYDFLNRLI